MHVYVPPKHLSCAAVAKAAGCSQRTVRRAVVDGELAGARTATGVIVVPVEEARRWIDARRAVTPITPARADKKKRAR